MIRFLATLMYMNAFKPGCIVWSHSNIVMVLTMSRPAQIRDSIVLLIAINVVYNWFAVWIWNERFGDETMNVNSYLNAVPL